MNVDIDTQLYFLYYNINDAMGDVVIIERWFWLMSPI